MEWNQDETGYFSLLVMRYQNKITIEAGSTPRRLLTLPMIIKFTKVKQHSRKYIKSARGTTVIADDPDLHTTNENALKLDWWMNMLTWSRRQNRPKKAHCHRGVRNAWMRLMNITEITQRTQEEIGKFAGVMLVLTTTALQRRWAIIHCNMATGLSGSDPVLHDLQFTGHGKYWQCINISSPQTISDWLWQVWHEFSTQLCQYLHSAGYDMHGLAYQYNSHS